MNFSLGLNLTGYINDDQNGSYSGHWQAESKSRGTSSILQTCLITLGLCVYNSIHLNIPPHPARNTFWFIKKLQWVLIAIFAPEIPVYMAFTQLKDARTVLKALRKSVWKYQHRRAWYRRFLDWTNELCGGDYGHLSSGDEEAQDVDKERPSKKHTLTEAFFVCMGGLAFSFPEEHRGVFAPDYVDRVCLSPEFAIMVAEKHPEIFPELSSDQVEDRSKAGSMVKAIACIQALWFCSQFGTRIAQELRVTLLELNTVVHTLCALLMYALWWKKPMDANEPICLPTDRSKLCRNLCASASLLSPFGRGVGRPLDEWLYGSKKGRTPSGLVTTIHRYPLRLSAKAFREQEIEDEALTKNVWIRHYWAPAPTRAIRVRYGLGYPPVPEPYRVSKAIPGTHYCLASDVDTSIRVDANTLKKLQWASRYDSSNGPLKFRLQPLFTSVPDFTLVDLSSRLNTVEDEADDGVQFTWYSFVALFVSGLFYGGSHLMAVGDQLQNWLVTGMWMGSCMAILCSWPLLVIIQLVESLAFAPFKRFLWARHALFCLRGIKGAAIGAYICARAFIVVESFMALAYAADPGIWQQPDWSVYFPHIS